MGKIYPSYKFVDHDPVLDQIDRLWQRADDARGYHLSAKYIESKSGVTVTTLRNWQKRKTKRPQFPTIKAVVRALGGEIGITFKGAPIQQRRTDGK